jgi:hypothetical protein
VICRGVLHLRRNRRASVCADDGRAGSACRRCFGVEIGHRPPSFPSHTERDSRDAVIEGMARGGQHPPQKILTWPLPCLDQYNLKRYAEQQRRERVPFAPAGSRRNNPGWQDPWSACRPAAWQSRLLGEISQRARPRPFRVRHADYRGRGLTRQRVSTMVKQVRAIADEIPKGSERVDVWLPPKLAARVRQMAEDARTKVSAS